jgi:membrane protein implicated in regulation of membrane protease activity
MRDQGVASAAANTAQQIGGSISTALLNTLAASAAASYLLQHPAGPLVAADATLHSYATAYWWAAGFFAFGSVLTALLFRRKRTAPANATAAEPAGSAADATAAKHARAA